MTEYDFSPEAYQAHLSNMARISNWVDRTEGHRSEFVDAAALTEEQRRSPQRRTSLGGRRRPPPPPLPIPPYEQPHYGLRSAPLMGMGMGMSPYPSPPNSSRSFDMGFAYANGPGSPGPMSSPPYMHMNPGHMPPQHCFGGPMMMPPQPSPVYDEMEHRSRSRRSQSPSYSYHSLLSSSSFYPPGGMGGQQPGYASGPGYVILPPTPSRRRKGKHRRGSSYSYIYV